MTLNWYYYYCTTILSMAGKIMSSNVVHFCSILVHFSSVVIVIAVQYLVIEGASVCLSVP